MFTTFYCHELRGHFEAGHVKDSHDTLRCVYRMEAYKRNMHARASIYATPAHTCSHTDIKTYFRAGTPVNEHTALAHTKQARARTHTVQIKGPRQQAAREAPKYRSSNDPRFALSTHVSPHRPAFFHQLSDLSCQSQYPDALHLAAKRTTRRKKKCYEGEA